MHLVTGALLGASVQGDADGGRGHAPWGCCAGHAAVRGHHVKGWPSSCQHPLGKEVGDASSCPLVSDVQGAPRTWGSRGGAWSPLHPAVVKAALPRAGCGAAAWRAVPGLSAGLCLSEVPCHWSGPGAGIHKLLLRAS